MKLSGAAERMQTGTLSACIATDIQWLRAPVNWRTLPFDDGSFEAIIASRVFEYVTDLDRAFREVTRILKVGGRLTFDVPNPASWRGMCERHLRAWTRTDRVRRMLFRVDGLQRYLLHLSLSENHFPVEEWESIATCYGLRAVSDHDEAKATSGTSVLTFRKVRHRRGAAGVSLAAP